MADSRQVLSESDALVISDLFTALAELEKAAGEDHYVSAHTEEGIRLWNVNGYSPGVFVLEDDFWMFRPDYKEL